MFFFFQATLNLPPDRQVETVQIVQLCARPVEMVAAAVNAPIVNVNSSVTSFSFIL